MTTLREAAQQALEALEAMNPYPASKEDQRAYAITALRAALAEPTVPSDCADSHQQAAELRRLHAELERCKQVCAATAEGWRVDAALAEPVQEPPCATQDCMPSECPNCASLEAQNTELDRKLAELEESNADELTVAYVMGAHSKLRTLTDEVIADLWYQNGTHHHHFARAIERYLKGEK